VIDAPSAKTREDCAALCQATPHCVGGTFRTTGGNACKLFTGSVGDEATGIPQDIATFLRVANISQSDYVASFVLRRPGQTTRTTTDEMAKNLADYGTQCGPCGTINKILTGCDTGACAPPSIITVLNRACTWRYPPDTVKFPGPNSVATHAAVFPKGGSTWHHDAAQRTYQFFDGLPFRVAMTIGSASPYDIWYLFWSVGTDDKYTLICETQSANSFAADTNSRLVLAYNASAKTLDIAFYRTGSSNIFNGLTRVA
jgi:hypothetical protein